MKIRFHALLAVKHRILLSVSLIASAVIPGVHALDLDASSRASLLTGRNPHTVHVGGYAMGPRGFPGYDTLIPLEAGTIRNVAFDFQGAMQKMMGKRGG